MSTHFANAGVGDRSGVDSLQQLANDHPLLVLLARAGWVAKGLVYGLVGVLAFPIAFQSKSNGTTNEASQSGAIARIARSSAGSAALWAVAFGLALYVLWRIVTILLPADNTLKAWATRVGYAVSALVYVALAWSAISFARRSKGTATAPAKTENSRVEQFTQHTLEHTGGRWLVGVIGAVFIAVAAVFLHKGITANFRKDLDGGGIGPISTDTVVRIGQVGWCARAAMMVLIGVFLIRATVQFNSTEAEGLDGALRRLVDTQWGPIWVAAIGVGLLLYGSFCVISAPLQRLRGAS